MLETGIVQMLNADPGVSSITTTGGFGFDELAKNMCLPSWAFRFAGGRSFVTLQSAQGLRWRRLEIHCMAGDADTTMQLAIAINVVLEGFSGLLPDDQPGTMVDSIFTSNTPVDFFDAGTRTYRRVLEYQVTFIPSTPGE